MGRFIRFLANYPIGIITLVFLIVQVILYNQYGVKVMSDSYRYIDWAQNLWQTPISTSQWKFWYISYVFSLSVVLPLGLKSMMILQMLVSWGACICIYHLTMRITSDRLSSFFAVLMYLLWIEISIWNLYVLTESLFTSMIIITVYLLHRSGNRRSLLYYLPLMLFTILLRPMGVTVMIALGIFLYYQFDLNERLTRRQQIALLSIGAVFLIAFLFILLEGNPDVHFYYARGQVVWGADQMDGLKNNPWLVVDNSNVIYPSGDLPDLLKFIEFSFTNFSFQVELFFRKLVLFIVHVKPYYSLGHNIFILLTLIPAYGLSIYGLTVTEGNKGLKYFAILLFSLNAVMTGLTVEPWDGRFLIPTLPFVFIYASIGLKKLLMKISFLRL